MTHLKRSLHLLFAFILVGGLSSCFFDRPIQPPRGKNADQLYKEGVSALNAKNYRQAIETFYKLKYDFPDEAAAMLADLRIADAYYANEDYSEAIEAYEEFRKMHPASPYIPYVVYMLGLCYFQMMHSVDRDQTNTERALSEFQYLLTHFPNTPYAYDANEKVQECMRRLSQHEVYVGDFYFRMKKYKAAILRYESALKRFPSIPLEPETLYRLGEAYRRTDQPQKAKKAWEALLKQYPKHKYSRKAEDRLHDLSAQAEVAAELLPTKSSPKPSHVAEPQDRGTYQEPSSPERPPNKGSSPSSPLEETRSGGVSSQTPASDTSAQRPDRTAPPAPEEQEKRIHTPVLSAESNAETEHAEAKQRPSSSPPPPEQAEVPSSVKNEPLSQGTQGEENAPSDLVSLFGKGSNSSDLQDQGTQESSQRKGGTSVTSDVSQKATVEPPLPQVNMETSAAAVHESEPETVQEENSLPPHGEGLSEGEPLAEATTSEDDGPTSAEVTSPQELQPSRPQGPATPAPGHEHRPAVTDTTDEGSGGKSMGFVELRGDLPINITADRMDAFQKENRVVFEGNVVVNQRDTYIYAQRISAELAPQELGGGIRKVVALKDVRITQKDRVATCDRAEFDNISRVIELSGNPKIWSGKDRIDGERVVIQLDQEKMTVVGSEDRRVSAVLYPKSRKAQRSPEEGPKEGIRPTFIAPFAPATDAVESPPAPKPPAEEEAPSMARAQTPEEETPTPPASSPPAPSPSPPPLPSEPQTAPVPPALYAEEQYAKIPSRLTGAEEGEGTPLPETQEVVERENAEPIPPSAPSAPPAEEEVDEVEVLAFLERWRSAWENKKLDAYMECYSRRFRSGGRDWKGWKDYKARLNRRYRFIRVEMEDVQVTANHEGLRVSFIQNYQSDRYKDRGRKILHLVREDGQWKILREEWKAL